MLPQPLEHYEDLQREADEHLQKLARAFPENMAARILAGESVDARISLIVRLKDAVGQLLEDKKRLTEPPTRFEVWLRDREIPSTPAAVESLARDAFKQGLRTRVYERSLFAMALWEIYGVLGFDLGEPSPEAFIVGAGGARFAARMVEAAKDYVKDHQEDQKDARREALQEAEEVAKEWGRTNEEGGYARSAFTVARKIRALWKKEQS